MVNMTIKAIFVPLLRAETKGGTALLLMGQEFCIIRGQFKRIRDHQDNLMLEVESEKDIPRMGEQFAKINLLDETAMMFGDIHFLLISMRRMESLFKEIKEELPKEPELAAIQKRYRNFFERIRKFRNKVEHIEGMVKKGVPYLGDVRASSFTFDEEEFYYGPEVEATITAFYEEVKNAHEAIVKRKGLKPFKKIKGQIRV
jgi:hypothetical protein